MTEKRLTKEQAQELYDDLNKAMNTMKARDKTTGERSGALRPEANSAAARQIARPTKSNATHRSSSLNATTADDLAPLRNSSAAQTRNMKGQAIAVTMIGLLCCAKITLSAFEASGVSTVEIAQAAVITAPRGPQWSKEEVKVLTALDSRRVELEERSARLEQHELEATARNRDLTGRLTELKAISERLKGERDKGDKQRNGQLEQLANVYGSMNPPEAAHLLEQLDIQVTLSLIERMPEKRMGQILSLMNAQRALELTNLLSKRPI